MKTHVVFEYLEESQAITELLRGMKNITQRVLLRKNCDQREMATALLRVFGMIRGYELGRGARLSRVEKK